MMTWIWIAAHPIYCGTCVGFIIIASLIFWLTDRDDWTNPSDDGE